MPISFSSVSSTLCQFRTCNVGVRIRCMCWKVDAAESHGLASTTVPSRLDVWPIPSNPTALHRRYRRGTAQWNYPCVHRPFVMLIEAADLHNKTTHTDHSTALTSLNASMIHIPVTLHSFLVLFQILFSIFIKKRNLHWLFNSLFSLQMW